MRHYVAGLALAWLSLTVSPAHAGMPLQLAARLDAHGDAPPPPPAAAAPLHLQIETDLRDGLIHAALETGVSLVGTEYQLGADRVDAVDCSAFVRRMFAAVGLQLPRTAREQLALGQSVDRGRLAPGDLLFYRFGRRGLHVAVYLANGELLHASTSDGQVTVSRNDDYWQRRLVAARRLI